MSNFLNKREWDKIERGYEFEAATPYPSDTKRPLSFFVPDSKDPTLGKVVSSTGDFSPSRSGGAREQQIIMTIKPRKVVVISSDEINRNSDFEYILVAPINTIKPYEKEREWYKKLIKDEHPIFTYLPKGDLDRYVDLSQSMSIHKTLLLKKYRAVSEDRMDVLDDNLVQCLSLGIIEEEIVEEEN
ncbi:type II toxin-antitoxin system PemK/MazF family toxin [Niallia taxi]|uniref:type II toxin-antitoxin system PemK/MazF family toxin n=1 Tax=Niallia taxi TaxID=2499688 RepID=UPI003D2D2F0A